MYGSDWMHGMPMMGWGGWIIMLVFWILVIAGIVVLARRLTSRQGPNESPSKSPIDILKERYARGEIDREQFEQMKRDLE